MMTLLLILQIIFVCLLILEKVLSITDRFR
jgi:hypothetical protein